MDVHRLVLLFGYKFSPRVSFITEIELEHVSEVYVESAFLNYKVNDWLSLRGGADPNGHCKSIPQPSCVSWC